MLQFVDQGTTGAPAGFWVELIVGSCAGSDVGGGVAGSVGIGVGGSEGFLEGVNVGGGVRILGLTGADVGLMVDDGGVGIVLGAVVAI